MTEVFVVEFTYNVPTSKGFDDAVSALEKALTEQKFGVLWKMDVQDRLSEKGVDFAGQVKILEVCNPQKAKAVLETEISAAYFLPCKVLVYVEDGQTKIGMVQPTVFMEMLDNADLKKYAQEVEGIMQKAIHSATH